ncbi:MAG: hypothetical protein KC609_17155 [Myxococcales bacterium]|nr:hypothetical protein [Myxococcales bacterium]
MSWRLLVIAVALCAATSAVNAKPLCLLTAEVDSGGAKRIWWSGDDWGHVPLTRAIAHALASGRLAVVPAQNKRPQMVVHARYQKWPLDPLDAINLAALFDCRMIVLGQLESASRGQLPVLKHETVQLSLAFTLLSVDSSRTLAVDKLVEFGFAPTRAGAETSAIQALTARLRRIVARSKKSASLLPLVHAPLLHIRGLRIWKQLEEVRGALRTVTFLSGSRIHSFRRGELTLALKLKKGVKTYDTADTLSVELGRLKLPGAELKVQRGRDREVWVRYQPSTLP